MSTGPRHQDLSALLRADGSVVVPAEVAGEVLRALMRDTTVRVRADGGEVSNGLRTLLYALHNAAEHPRHDPPGSGSGSATAAPGNVVSVTEAAALLECSPRWVRHLISTGRLSARRAGARCWLVDHTSLDAYRKGTHGQDI